MGGAVIVIKTLDDWKAQLELAKNEQKACIVDFFATWCGPCKMISPLFEDLSNKTPTVYFLKIDVDDTPAVAEACGITAMPTFQVFVNGAKVDDLVGASREKLQSLVEKYKDLTSPSA